MERPDSAGVRRRDAAHRVPDASKRRNDDMSVVARAHARARVDGASAASASRNARPRGKTIKMRGTDEKGDGASGGGLFSKVEKLAEKVGVSLGPIGMTLQEGEVKKKTTTTTTTEGSEEESYERPPSIASMSSAQWREKYVKTDGTVDLWLEDDFNIASRKAGACDAESLVNIENYAWSGMKTTDVNAPIRNVKVTDHETGEVLELDVPEGRYILFEAEQQGWVLPNACRMGGCTKCAVKISKGSVEQPESLGLSKELKDQGYALLCVATATEDVECVTQDEEEVYMKQFGKSFAEMALDKNASSVLRDDFAFEIADMDE